MKFILSILVSTAHAGWFTNFCEKHLIADDPYQFEQADLEWLIRYHDWHRVKYQAGTLSRSDFKIYLIIRNELSDRARYAPYKEFELIKKALHD